MPPIIIHATMSLSNWRKLDPEGAFSLPNLTTIYSLDSTRWLISASLVTKPHFRDLEVFFMVPLLVEKASTPAVKAILTIQVPFYLFFIWRPSQTTSEQALAQEDPVPWTQVAFLLATITSAIGEMRDELAQLHEGCRPATFYHQHRPLLSGWKGNPSLPKGLIYEGVSEEPVQLSGGSAAQSASLQLLDAGLGVVHHGEEGEFLATMRDQYMPPNQVPLSPQILSSGV